MNRSQHLPSRLAVVVLVFVFVASLVTATRITAQDAGPSAKAAASDLAPGSADLIKPEELAKILQSGSAKPLVLNVGPRFLYAQAHIPGAEYMGATAEPQALEKLRQRVKPLPRNTPVVLYCGCCPWEHCPNVRPAYKELRNMGFSKAKVLYIANTFGTDWVEKGYPVAKGE